MGATSERSGFDESATVEARDELFAAAARFLPAIADVREPERLRRLEPGTPRRLPLIGETAVDGLLVATGHYRNGILLAPVTATAVAALLTGEPPPPSWPEADPTRFA